jgi:hypothetical protein
MSFISFRRLQRFYTKLKANLDTLYAPLSTSHTHSNKTVLDASTASYTTADKTNLDNSIYFRSVIKGSSGDDFNQIVDRGIYRYNTSPTNYPSTTSGNDYGTLVVFNPDNDYVVQVAYSKLGSGNFLKIGGVFIRSSSDKGSTWSDWIRMATASDSGEQTLAPNTTYMDSDNTAVKYRKIGNVVEVYGYFATSTVAGSGTVGTLPSGYRPAVRRQCASMTTSGALFAVNVNTDGTVTLGSGSASTFAKGTQQYFSINYLIA